jgi:hypothetical protein
MSDCFGQPHLSVLIIFSLCVLAGERCIEVPHKTYLDFVFDGAKITQQRKSGPGHTLIPKKHQWAKMLNEQALGDPSLFFVQSREKKRKKDVCWTFW